MAVKTVKKKASEDRLLAYHSDAAIKRKYVKRVEAHRQADELVQGTGWKSNGHARGCAVGCTFNEYDHARGPVEIGVPVHLVYLEDAIFEGLPRADALLWPTRFLKAIPVGADLSLVWPRFAVWMLTDAKHGVIRFAGKFKNLRKSIEAVSALWQRVIDGETAESLRGEFAAAADAAAAARWSAAAAAAAAAARWSADADAAAAAARWSADADAAAAAAADAARWSADAAAAAARHVHWKACADKCIELIKAT